MVWVGSAIDKFYGLDEEGNGNSRGSGGGSEEEVAAGDGEEEVWGPGG